MNTALRYFTTAATRQLLIEESQSALRSRALVREHVRLVAEHIPTEQRQAELEQLRAEAESRSFEQSPETGYFPHDV